jgi:hypothetical protein
MPFEKNGSNTIVGMKNFPDKFHRAAFSVKRLIVSPKHAYGYELDDGRDRGRQTAASEILNVRDASLERVQHLHTCLSEIARVSRGNGEIMLKRSGSNRSIQERQRLTFPLQIRHQHGPAPADHSVPRLVVSVRSIGWNRQRLVSVDTFL